MKIPPHKPHFFKPIVPGFKQGLKVPKGFLKYLKGEDHENGILRRDGKKWQVKLNGDRFEAGWAEFAEEHDLQLGNIVVFRHERDMEFDVSIFDSSDCEREYTEHLQKEEKEEELEEVEAFPKIEAAKDMASHFICTFKSYNLSKCFLRVPMPFARENGLNNRKCMMTIKDGQKSWTFSLYSCGKITYIGGGWRSFCQANCLKEGDRVMFEIVSNGEKPILTFHVLFKTRSERKQVSPG